MSKTSDTVKQNARTTFRQFFMLLRAFYNSEGKRRARMLLVTLLALALAVAGVQLLMSYAGRDLFTAISDKDQPGYMRCLLLYLGAFALAVPIGVFYRYAEERLALLWRQWMTHHLVKRYFNNRAYYRLRSSETIDNPDQRIAEDIKNFTSITLSFLLIALNATITLIAFIGVLWSISINLVFVLLAYAVFGTGMSIFIGRRLVGLHYKQYQREGDFRYSLIRVRDNAESIAFYRGEKREHRDLVQRFAEVVTNTMSIIGWNRNLSFFTTSFNYAAIILPIIVVAPMFIRGEVSFGVVPQAAGVFAQVLAALTLVIAQFERLSAFSAGVARIGSLWDHLDESDAEDQRESQNPEILVEEVKRGLELEALTVQTPGGAKILVRELSLALKPAQSLLIMGESGAGKSSLLRTVAGIWQSGSGNISRPALKDMMFLPQRPYMVPGSLRDQLQYPNPDSTTDDAMLRDALDQVNLLSVLDRVDGDLDAVTDWSNVLSLGEQQRISFARLLLRKPALVFLDEATSALDEPNEQRLYEWLSKSKLIYVSVGHRSTLKAYHERLLTLSKDGSSNLGPCDA